VFIVVIVIIALMLGILVGGYAITNNINNKKNNTNNITDNNVPTNENLDEVSAEEPLVNEEEPGADDDSQDESNQTIDIPEVENGEDINNLKKITNTSKSGRIKYTYASEGEMSVMDSITINGVSIKDKLSDEYFNTIDINEKTNFVIINISSGGTCGYETWDLLIFDYNGNLLYKNKDIPNDLDKLVYAGKYEIDKNNNITLDYHLSCDTDCNICERLYDEERFDIVCEKVNQYGNVISNAKYRVNYSNKKFGEETLLSSTLFKYDSTYSNYFDRCNN
jgi:hypothetical protein